LLLHPLLNEIYGSDIAAATPLTIISYILNHRFDYSCLPSRTPFRAPPRHPCLRSIGDWRLPFTLEYRWFAIMPEPSFNPPLPLQYTFAFCCCCRFLIGKKSKINVNVQAAHANWHDLYGINKLLNCVHN